MSVSILDWQRNYEREAIARGDEALDALRGADICTSAELEADGHELYEQGAPISDRWCVQMRRGWEQAAADSVYAETQSKPWLADEPEDWTAALSAQIERNERVLTANAKILAGGR